MDEHTTSTTSEKQQPKPLPKQSRQWQRPAAIAVALLASVIVVAGGYVGYLYASTPLSIRQPLYEHYHFRMSLSVNGKEVNFAENKFQEGYSKDNCNANLTEHPIHFHDNKNHFVHIHWEGMTGGQVLKYYGWNFIGGAKGSMGYRFDSSARLKKVPLHGNVLPALPNDARYYIYIGSADKYTEKKFESFTTQDLEKFFGKESNSPANKLNKEKRKSSLVDALFPKAQAHGNEEEHANEETTASTGPEDQELKVLNNLVGDAVIFVQKDAPSDTQIKDRFNHLEPLGESACAG
jgi:hypothetical protein